MEGGTLRCLVRFVGGRVTIAHAQDFTRPLDSEANDVACRRNGAAHVIDDAHSDPRQIGAVCLESGTIRCQRDPGSNARGFPNGTELLTLARSLGLQFARSIGDLPFQMAVSFHCFFPEGFSVEEQFHLIAITVNPHGNFLSFLAWPVPMRKDMQDGFATPPRFVIPIRILGESAGVHNAEGGTDRRLSGLAEWGRFTFVVEARPYEVASHPWAIGNGLPTHLARLIPTRAIFAIVAQVAFLFVAIQYRACTHGIFKRGAVIESTGRGFTAGLRA